MDSQLSSLSIPALVLVLNSQGSIQFINPSAETMLGYSLADLEGQAVWETLFMASDAPLLRADLEWVQTHSQSVRREYSCRTRSNEAHQIAWEFSPLPTTNNILVIGSESSSESESRYRHLVEASSDGIVLHVDEHIIYANPAAVRILGGSSQADLVGRTAAEFVHPDYQSIVAERTRKFKAGVSTLELLEETLIRLDGSLVEVEVLSAAVMYQGKKAVQTLFRDIGERKWARQVQTEQYTFAEALGSTATDLLHVTPHLDKLLEKVLKNMSQVVPYTTASIMLIESGAAHVAACRGFEERGEDAAGIVGLQFPIATTPNLQLMLDTGNSFSIPDTQLFEGWRKEIGLSWIRSHIGTPIWIEGEIIGFLNLDSAEVNAFNDDHLFRLEVFAGLIANAIQNARLYQTIQLNNTDLERRVEERTARLMEEKERVEAILNSSSDAIILVNTDSIIKQTNPAFDELFAYEIDELFGKTLFVAVIPDQAGWLEQEINSLWGTEHRKGRIEVQAQRKDGTSFDADLSFSPVRNSEGDIMGIICSFRDISPQKQAEEKLRHALENERELGEMRARFVTTTSHEFRTPLTSILSSSELLRNYRHRMDDNSINHKLDNIYQQVQHMTDLLEDVLMVGRLESGATQLNLEALNLEAFIQEFIDDYQQAIHSGHQIRYQPQGVCGEVRVDKKLIRQIIDNLLSNAIKYSPHHLEVDFSLICNDSLLTLVIQDYGIGIPPHDQKRIFEPFHRADNVSTIPGTGLGLAIAKRAVELHGGQMSLTSTVGVGSTFTINLPRQ
jgi:PAS domain S-box-containing protein